MSLFLAASPRRRVPVSRDAQHRPAHSAGLAFRESAHYHQRVQKGASMPNFLLQVGYTPEAWASLIANPHDRIDAVRPVVEKLGGKITQGWFAFGEYDLIAIIDMPGNVEAAAFSLAAAAGGSVRTIKTTPLLSTAEGVEAMKKASKSGYKAPAHAARA